MGTTVRPSKGTKAALPKPSALTVEEVREAVNQAVAQGKIEETERELWLERIACEPTALVELTAHDRRVVPLVEIGYEEAPAPRLSLIAAGTGLQLITGIPDDVREVLEPEDERYGMFAWAAVHQHHWDWDEHREYWETHLARWPLANQRPPKRHQKAIAVVLGRRRGLADHAIPPAGKYDSWRSKRIFKLADEVEKRLSLGTLGPRLPLICPGDVFMGPPGRGERRSQPRP